LFGEVLPPRALLRKLDGSNAKDFDPLPPLCHRRATRHPKFREFGMKKFGQVAYALLLPGNALVFQGYQGH
jgi:hypothetical protein